MKDQKTVLVTGGAGFIGSHLVRRLLKDGYDVAVLTKEATDMHRIVDVLPARHASQGDAGGPRITVLHDDLSDGERLKKVMSELRPYGVFHCAASNIKQGVAAPEDDLIRVNFTGTVHLVQALQHVEYKFFINCGTYIEYGIKDNPLTESDRCEPGEIYALTKLAATLYCQSVARSAGKPIVTFRIFSPYGRDMERGRLVYEVVNRALRGEEITVAKPETSRDFIFVEDLVDLYMEAMDKARDLKGEIFNIGSGRAMTLKNLVERTLRLTGSQSHVVWGGMKDLAYDRGCQQANMEKTYSAFTWRPGRDLDAGIKSMVDWFASRKIE